MAKSVLQLEDSAQDDVTQAIALDCLRAALFMQSGTIHVIDFTEGKKVGELFPFEKSERAQI